MHLDRFLRFGDKDPRISCTFSVYRGSNLSRVEGLVKLTLLCLLVEKFGSVSYSADRNLWSSVCCIRFQSVTLLSRMRSDFTMMASLKCSFHGI